MFRIALFLALVVVAQPAGAQSFSDVLGAREEFDAVNDLKYRGIVEGRPDGTFGPDDLVNRAEAITVVVRAVANVHNLPPLADCFPDVYGDQWYVRPVCYAADLEWVGGYPDGTFQPVRTVAKVEFLKILLNAYGADTDPLVPLLQPIAADALNSDEWYFPYLAYALAGSMTSADDLGNLNPGAALTRGQVALLMHRYLLYREGKRNQALLTNAEKDTRLVFSHLEALDVDRAAYAVHRMRVAAWGAVQRLPESTVVLVTVKLGEALQALVEAYRRVQSGDLTAALQAAKDAYRRADETDALNRGVTVYTDRVRSYAHELANEIRSYGGN